MAAAHAAGRTLQWMRSAPKRAASTAGGGTASSSSSSSSSSWYADEELDAGAGDFLPDKSSHHFKTLDAAGLRAQQREIDEAARRLLARRKSTRAKAWGAPRKTEADFQRSLVPRSAGPGRPASPEAARAGPDYDALNSSVSQASILATARCY